MTIATMCVACGGEIDAQLSHYNRTAFNTPGGHVVESLDICMRCYPIAERMLRSTDSDWLLDGFELCKPEEADCGPA